MSESVSVVIPVYNEIENLDALLERVVSTCEDLPNPWECRFLTVLSTRSQD